MATQPSILAWRIPMDRGSGGLQSIVVSKDSDTTEVTEQALDFAPSPPLPPTTSPHHHQCLSPSFLQVQKGIAQCLILWILESTCTNSGSNSALHCVSLVKLYNLLKSLFPNISSTNNDSI